MNTNKIKSPFELLQYNVLNFEFTNNAVAQKNNDEAERIFDVDYEIAHKHAEDDFQYGVVELIVNAKRISDGEEHFDMQIKINGFFRSPADTSSDMFNKMLEHNGVTALYGICRGIISSLSTLCYPKEPVVLPMVNINSLVNHHKNK